MTPEDRKLIAEIEARVEAATLGPWQREWGIGEDDICSVNPSVDLGDLGHRLKPIARVLLYPDYVSTFRMEAAANAEFIARAREDIPRLLSIIAEQERELESLRPKCSRGAIIGESIGAKP
jgi:hypothetical protein